MFVTLYGEKVCDDVTDMRYSKHMNIAAKLIKTNPEALQPKKKRAAHFHALRVNLDLQQWNNSNSEVLKLEDWGWKLETIGTS